MFDNTDIRGEIVSLDTSFQQAHKDQHFPNSLTPLFGQFIAAAALLSEVLKFEGVLTLQARGEGDVDLIMAEVTDSGSLRGIIHMSEETPESPVELPDFTQLSLPEILVNGLLTITIDPVQGKRYQGIILVEAATLADCLMHYFDQSEQIPTYVKLYSDHLFCGGLFLQSLPAQLIKDSEKREELWHTCCHLAATLKPEELFTLDNKVVLLRLFHEMQCRTFEPKTVKFECSCSRNRSANAIRSLGFQEAQKVLQERDIINVDCQLCGTSYAYGESDIVEIFHTEDKPLH